MIISIMIDTLLKYWPVFPAVFAAGIVDAIAGGGGLITLPVYMLVGLPPHEAIGTNKMSSCMGTTTATYKFAREGYINYRMAVFAVVFALAGSYTGAHISLLISNRFFKILMLFILPVTAWFVLRTRNFDVEREPYSFRKTCILSCVIAFAIGVYDGFYGPGTGTFLILLLTSAAHLTLKEANGRADSAGTNGRALQHRRKLDRRLFFRQKGRGGRQTGNGAGADGLSCEDDHGTYRGLTRIPETRIPKMSSTSAIIS